MTIEEIEADIKSKTQLAVKYAQKDIEEICRKHVWKFYADFSPKLYQRTYQLPNTVLKSGVQSFGLGARGKVYFDSSQLNYDSVIRLKDGNIGFSNWSEETVFELAMNGSHGGEPGRTGHNIWESASRELNDKTDNILIKSCSKAGL